MKTAKSPAKKARPTVPDYCDVEVKRDEHGQKIWPAPEEAIEQARAFIKRCAASKKKVLLVPDKDADGISSGMILYRTLQALNVSEELIDVHLIRKGNSIHDDTERCAMQDKQAAFIIVLDQGSRSAPSVVDDTSTESLIIDHHLSDDFPSGAQVVSACHYPPVATSSLLTYEICRTLDPSIADSTAWLACIGTHGDLGNTLKWQPPFPDMSTTFKTHTKKSINDAVSLLNAPRRTAQFDVISAWRALLAAASPKDLLSNTRLQAARAEINAQVELHTHTPPRFSPDGRIAVLRIDSPAQIHPVIATRWAGHLSSRTLEIIMCANAGYQPGMINFSCRIARSARGKHPPVNIIDALKAAADLSADGLTQRLGESFARGHKEASGGIVPIAAFDELMTLMKIGEKKESNEEGSSPPRKKQKVIDASQKNTLGNYFAKAATKTTTTTTKAAS